MVVGDKFLRRGIGNELLRELIQSAENGAASAILLEVRESNLPARRLYEKNGFREVGTAGRITGIRRRTRFCMRFGSPRAPPGRS